MEISRHLPTKPKIASPGRGLQQRALWYSIPSIVTLRPRLIGSFPADALEHQAIQTGGSSTIMPKAAIHGSTTLRIGGHCASTPRSS
jgi:hypothetical protein